MPKSSTASSPNQLFSRGYALTVQWSSVSEAFRPFRREVGGGGGGAEEEEATGKIGRVNPNSHIPHLQAHLA